MRGRLVEAGFALGWALARRVPLALLWPLFRLAARVAARRRGRGTCRLEANLARVLAPVSDADLARVTEQGLRSYARYWLEVFRLPAVAPSVTAARTKLVHSERITEAMAAGNGVIFALPHMANWDQAGVWLVENGVPFTTVAERLKPEALFDRFVAFREAIGMEVVPLTGGASPPFDVLEQRLRGGGALCLLADRDLTPRGVPVRFFEQTASMPAGPALLALRTGARLHPVTLWWDDPTPPSTMTCEVHDQVLVPEGGTEGERVGQMTQRLADVFADAIRCHPADWHMLQRLWTADLDPSRRPTPGSDADYGSPPHGSPPHGDPTQPQPRSGASAAERAG